MAWSCLAAIIAVTALPGPACAQSGADDLFEIAEHPDVPTMLHLPDPITRARVHHGGEIYVTHAGSTLHVRPQSSALAGVGALLEVTTRTMRLTFRLRVVENARDAHEHIVVLGMESEQVAEEFTPDAAAAPGIRGTGRAPEPAGSISATDTAHADPVAGRATTAADAPHFDLSVHTVAGLPGFTALDVPGYAPRDARQVHLAFGIRVIGTPCGAWWAVQADISGEWLVAPTVHVKPISDVLQEVLESSGPWLRLDMGMRVGFGTNWRPTAHAGVGLQAHLRNTEKRSNNLTLPGDDVQTSSERTILFGGAFVLGMGFEYRTDDVLLGVDVQIGQGVPADYRSVAVLLFLGYFLDRGR